MREGAWGSAPVDDEKYQQFLEAQEQQKQAQTRVEEEQRQAQTREKALDLATEPDTKIESDNEKVTALINYLNFNKNELTEVVQTLEYLKNNQEIANRSEKIAKFEGYIEITTKIIDQVRAEVAQLMAADRPVSPDMGAVPTGGEMPVMTEQVPVATGGEQEQVEQNSVAI